jgi:hypothetical protein
MNTRVKAKTSLVSEESRAADTDKDMAVLS